MVIGMIVGESESAGALSVCQALSGGTFVYLACCHLLIEDFLDDQREKDEID